MMQVNPFEVAELLDETFFGQAAPHHRSAFSMCLSRSLLKLTKPWKLRIDDTVAIFTECADDTQKEVA